MIKQIIGLALLTTITTLLIYLTSTPVKVHTQPDPLMLQDACITGYVGKLKPITIDLVVDANVYCSEKYPK